MNRKVFSIDCLQIVSISESKNTLIATKLESNQESDKWIIREIHETNDVFINKSKRFVESKSDRIYAQKRLILAKIGTNRKSGFNPIDIIVNTRALTQQELNRVYNGSHLNRVVLLRISSSDYILLSFDKIQSPIAIKFDTYFGFNQFLRRFPEQIQALYKGLQ